MVSFGTCGHDALSPPRPPPKSVLSRVPWVSQYLEGFHDISLRACVTAPKLSQVAGRAGNTKVGRAGQHGGGNPPPDLRTESLGKLGGC